MKPDNQISITDKIVASANSIREKPSEEIREQLISLINELIKNDFQSLVQLLYRIDVDEKKLKEALKNNSQHDSAPVIAELIIERQLQKIKIRYQNKGPKNKNDAEEKW
jgi:hypothetical protein